MCKASIAAALVAFGIIALVQEGTNAMVTPPAGLLPALTIGAVPALAQPQFHRRYCWTSLPGVYGGT